MSPEIMVLLMFVALFIGIFLGYPTAFVLGGVAMVFGWIDGGPEVFNLFITRLYDLMKSYTLLAVPLFLFMGVFMERAGVAKRLFNALHLLWGGIRGGLGISTIAISALFAATTGVVGASEVTIGLMALPSMLKHRYDRALACGSICAGGTLGILIPPSVMIVIYGPIARISVGKLFLGTVVPGLLLSLLYMLYIGLRCYLRPQDGPPMPKAERDAVPTRRKLGMLLTSVVPPALLILAVLGSIFFGIAAVTEAAAVGVITSMVLAACYGQFNFKILKEAAFETLSITSMILMIAVGASFFSTVFVSIGGDDVISDLFLSLPFGKWGVLTVIMLLLVVLGMFIDWMGILFIVVPLITPIAAELGFDPVWFAVLVMVNLQISFLTPPFAYSIFYLKGITPPEVAITDIYRGVLPFVALQVLAIVLCILFPELLTTLPALLID